jgi:hypothetical protein
VTATMPVLEAATALALLLLGVSAPASDRVGRLSFLGGGFFPPPKFGRPLPAVPLFRPTVFFCCAPSSTARFSQPSVLGVASWGSGGEATEPGVVLRPRTVSYCDPDHNSSPRLQLYQGHAAPYHPEIYIPRGARDGRDLRAHRHPHCAARG